MNPRSIQLLVLVFCTFGLCSPAGAGEVRIAVASNFTLPMNEIISRFETQSGHQVSVSFGSSGSIYAQLINGAPFDAFFSADQSKPIALESAGLSLAGSRFTYAIGRLVLWSSISNLDLEDAAPIRQGTYERLALANPRLAPYGAAALEVLDNFGISESSRARWIQGENIAQTFQFVSSGNADLGFVALSQVTGNGSMRSGSFWLVPQDLYTPIRQDAVLLKSAAQNSAALEFMNFVRSPEISDIMQAYGYSSDASAENETANSAGTP